jgi:two-component system C4-dicarboxylate transport response regulator DctD
MSDQFRVMLVDDDEDTQKIFRVVMQHYQLPLEIFTDAESALERLKEKPDPDVMVIDIVLPGIDGYQMLGRSRILAPDCQMVATTAYHSQTTANEVVNWGFNGYLPKPLQPATLVEDLKRFMAHN